MFEHEDYVVISEARGNEENVTTLLDISGTADMQSDLYVVMEITAHFWNSS